MMLATVLLLLCPIFASLFPVSAAERTGALKPFAKHGMSGTTIVFSEEDLAENLLGSQKLTGLLVTAVSGEGGAFLLGDTAVSDGTVIPRERFSALVFRPEADGDAQGRLDFLPIFAVGSTETAGEASRITVSLGGKRNFAPTAADLKLSCYAGVARPIELSAYDPEGDPLAYTVISAPGHGTLSLVDGKLLYTPGNKRNGETSFSYYATDNAGNSSAVASVTVCTQKRETDIVYADLSDTALQHAAITLAEEGLYKGRSVGGHLLFEADEPITRGEFITLAATLLDLTPTTAVSHTSAGVADWQSAYLAAAAEAQIVSDTRYDDAITGAEAAAIIARFLHAEGPAVLNSDVPAWAAADVGAVTALGLWSGRDALTETFLRGDAAILLAGAAELRRGDRLGWQKYDLK